MCQVLQKYAKEYAELLLQTPDRREAATHTSSCQGSKA